MKKCTLLLMALSLFILANSQSWDLTGNAATNPSINFLGTIDNQPLRFRINNVYAGEIDSVTTKTFLGFGAGSHITTGIRNVAIGFKALYSTTTGVDNTANGYNALYLNTTGSFNTGNGFTSLFSNTTGSYNTANGYGALYSNTTGISNSATGFGALQSNTSASNNTANGYFALSSNTIGSFNTAVGMYALLYNYGGLASYNTAMGANALLFTTNSQYNTAIGYNAGWRYDLGYNNTILGANSDGSFAGQYNIIAIGQGVTCPDNSTARIGNSATWSIGGYANWTNISDGRFKKDIKEDVKGLDFIMKLRPVTYRLDIGGLSKQSKENQGKEWNEQMKTAMAEKEKVIFSGFVAQEVEAAAKETGYDFSGVDKPKNEKDLYGLRYAEFVVPLVKAVQELSTENTDLKKQVEDLQERMKRLESSFVTKK